MENVERILERFFEQFFKEFFGEFLRIIGEFFWWMLTTLKNRLQNPGFRAGREFFVRYLTEDKVNAGGPTRKFWSAMIDEIFSEHQIFECLSIVSFPHTMSKSKIFDFRPTLHKNCSWKFVSGRQGVRERQKERERQIENIKFPI